ncbi:complement C3-like [Ptychodera flava]|uniref:complement C3-like n=1 Tax=Ptychodera flava TaxID=63121 RepID=UPI00396A43F2
MGVFTLTGCLLLFVTLAAAQNGATYFISAPNVFRLGVDETVSVTIFNVNNPVTVRLYLQDYPNRQKTFAEVQGEFVKDVPQSLKMKMNYEDLPERKSHEEVGTKKYVYLVAKSDSPELTFQKEEVILVSFRSGYVFIQTDKPIYTPEQEVKMRVLPLNSNMRPSEDPVRLEILNPQGTIVERRNELQTDTGMIVETFLFPLYPLFGNWTVNVFFGAEYALNASVQFEVREYVLPTYSIKIHAPQYILPQAQRVEGSVEAMYVYGKPVTGSLYMRFGVQDGPHTVRIVRELSSGVREGHGFFDFDTADLGDNWFEDNEGKRLYIEASITEDATGLMENMTDNSPVFAKSPYKFRFDKTVKNFKPGLPYRMKIDVLYANNKPVRGIPVVINTRAITPGGEIDLLAGGQNNNDNDISNSDGETSFALDIPRDAQSIRVTAKTGDETILPEQNAEAVFIGQPYQSASNSYLLINLEAQEIFVGENLVANAVVTKAEDVSRINYMVVTRGKITHQATVVKEAGVISTLSFRVTSEMSPSSRLIVYYINRQNEVVADALWLDIEDVCENRMVVTANHAQRKPGDEAKITVDADPHTLVGLLAVDKAVYLLNNANRLTRQKMFQSMDKFDLGCGPGGGQDSKQVFEDSGIMVLTNAGIDMEKREAYGCIAAAAARRRRRDLSDLANSYEGEERDYCIRGQEPDPDQTNCDNRARRIMDQLQTSEEDDRIAAFLRCCKETFEPDRIGRIGGFEDEWTNPDNIFEDESDIQVRSDFPETWIFEDHVVDATGQFSLDVTVPSSLTTWVIQAVGVSRESGMCVAEPFEMTAFKEFFIALNLPYSVVRGEQVEIQAAVFNYGDNELVVRVYLQGVEGLCAGARPGEQSQRKQFNVPGNDATSVTFPVIPMEVGEIPIRIKAFSPAGGDIVEKLLRVVPEGQEKTFVHSVVLDPAGQMCEAGNDKCGNGQPPNADNAIQSDEFRVKEDQLQINLLDIRLPDEVVPGSAKCGVNVIGSLMGPTVKAVIEGNGLHSLLRQPTGCGEQTLLGLAPDIYVLLYLSRTNQVTEDIEKKAFKFIRDGYNRELTYRNKDTGCFSVWAGRACSTWLTAFSMKIFCQAKEFIFVDQQVICQATRWLLTMQNEDGSFRENYMVHHKEMTGGVHGAPSFTAFVLIALEECDCDAGEMTTAKLGAKSYLERELPNLQRPYTVAIVTYALALTNSEKAGEANQMLKNLAVFDEAKNMRYWNTDDSSFGSGNKPYWYSRKPSAIAVETTSYALLAQLKLGDISYSNPIVVWLTKQRNSQGGFVSTQDTVMALQALAQYTAQTDTPELDLQCEVKSSKDPNFVRNFLIQNDNALIEQHSQVPLIGQLQIDTRGTGTGQLQVEVRYNVPRTDIEQCAFDIDIQAVEPRVGRILDLGGILGRSRVGRQAGDGRSNYVVNIEVCARYKREGKTSMAIMDVGLFTGFKPIKEDLEKILNDVDSPVQRYEITDRSVIFYVDEISSDENEKVCVKFNAKQEYKVGQIQPVAVNVYDYYSPDNECTKFYHAAQGSPLLSTLCVGELCVCAEGKCGEPSDDNYLSHNELTRTACDEADYVFDIEVADIVKEGSFDVISAVVDRPVKIGLDEVLPNEVRKFWKRSSCRNPNLRVGERYLIMGVDGIASVNENGVESLKYIIDEETHVEWYPSGDKLRRRKWKKIAQRMTTFGDRLLQQGCIH